MKCGHPEMALTETDQVDPAGFSLPFSLSSQNMNYRCFLPNLAGFIQAMALKGRKIDEIQLDLINSIKSLSGFHARISRFRVTRNCYLPR